MLPSAKKEWKRILVILGIYTVWWLAIILSLISFQGLDATIKQYGSVSQMYGSLIHTVIMGSITYYILIYKMAIPLIRTGKWKKVLLQYVLLLLLSNCPWVFVEF